MSTYYVIMVCGSQKEKYQMSKGNSLTLQHVEPFVHHYLYIGSVDNHTAMCHERVKNRRLGWRMRGLPTGGQS